MNETRFAETCRRIVLAPNLDTAREHSDSLEEAIMWAFSDREWLANEVSKLKREMALVREWRENTKKLLTWVSE